MDALFQLSSGKGPAPSLAAVDFAQAAIASGRFRLTAWLSKEARDRDSIRARPASAWTPGKSISSSTSSASTPGRSSSSKYSIRRSTEFRYPMVRWKILLAL